MPHTWLLPISSKQRLHAKSMRTTSLIVMSMLCLSACGTSSPPGDQVPAAQQGQPTPEPGQAHDESDDSKGNDGALILPPVASLTNGEWLAGDLHIHSDYSDDASNNPVAKITSLAEEVGLDYLAITDHDNHVDGEVAANTWSDPDFMATPLIMLYGAEWTTHRGHGNTFAAAPYDHKRFYDLRDDLDTRIGELADELGFHFSANHPAGGDNFGFSFDIVDSIEVWNSAIWSLNTGAVAIWDDMLKSGRDLTGRGGSDSHHGYPGLGDTLSNNSIQAGGNNVGTPTTWVFATARTPEAVIEALTNGRVSVSSNPNAPRVEFVADLDKDGEADMMMGDNVVPSGDAVAFRVRLVGGPIAVLPYSVRVIKDGAEFTALRIPPGSTEATFVDTPEFGKRSYYRVEVTGQQAFFPDVPASAALSGRMIALSNPLYFNFDPAF